MQSILWEALLEAQRCIHQFEGQLLFCCIDYSAERPVVSINRRLQGEKVITILLEGSAGSNLQGTHFCFRDKLLVDLITAGAISNEDLQLLQCYLPYCFLSYFARQRKRSMAVAHFAQSLDGRIATVSGDSRWIGNEENLDHAHRMRALCDAILVGKQTITSDKPKLTVRRVAGANPLRIILASSAPDYSSLLNSCEDPILVIGTAMQSQNGKVKNICLECPEQTINGRQILEYLYSQRIHSVYIEGGAITTSNFIKDKAVDILQLHVSPLLFGSGKPGINLPEISNVGHALQFRHFNWYPVGNTVMFVGQFED